jgi:ABC-type cobalamin/Fe3+-siderophores transport system ATPase subunit
LAVEAPVLLLDEPTTHLDPPHQEDVARLLREQAHRCGVSVLSAIHDLSLALTADVGAPTFLLTDASSASSGCCSSRERSSLASAS